MNSLIRASIAIVVAGTSLAQHGVRAGGVRVGVGFGGRGFAGGYRSFGVRPGVRPWAFGYRPFVRGFLPVWAPYGYGYGLRYSGIYTPYEYQTSPNVTVIYPEPVVTSNHFYQPSIPSPSPDRGTASRPGKR